MTINGGSSILSFPWDGVIPPEEILIIRDVDVVGVGALRRFQLESLQKTKKFILETHEPLIPENVHAIYQEELLRTLQWLRPIKTISSKKLDFKKEQCDLFTKLFPLTEQLLGIAVQKVRDAYLEEMEWSSWLLQDHWRYFSGFIRQKFPDNIELRELVHWEWVQTWLEIQPFGSVYKDDVGTVVLNPSLQIVKLTRGQALLSRPPGLYVFVYNDLKNKINEKSVDIYEAYLLDLFNEDRKYTRDQLVSMAVLNKELGEKISLQEWNAKCEDLLQASVLLAV